MAKRFEKAKEYTQKYKNVLLPCKWCGNTDIRIVSDREMWPSKAVWCVVCSTPSCDCTHTCSSVREAIRAWNNQQSRKD